jgi:hypothetical protein
VTDLQEEPAVPPFDGKGDERAGYFASGAILIGLGWGLGVVVNVVLHLTAPVGGVWVAGVYFARSFGDYAWAVLGFGLVTGVLGVAILGVGRTASRGPLVLPGYEY